MRANMGVAGAVRTLAVMVAAAVLSAGLSGCDRGAEPAAKTQNNMRQIAMAINLYHDSNKKYPDTLNELLPFVENNPKTFVNPRTGADPGYEYVKPPEGAAMEKGGTTIVLWELKDGQRDPNGYVAYLDVHTEKAPPVP